MTDHLHPGDRIWQYVVEEFLGEGTFACTYKARHLTMLKRLVAIKQLKQSRQTNNETIERFISEAFALAEISHPNIVGIFELIRPNIYPNEVRYSIVMEYMDGGTLEKWMERDDKILMSLPNALRVTKCILLGVAAAHHEGIIHRDLKPANILLSRDGSIIKLADWGLAHIETRRMTSTGMYMGTLQYMAPEQARGDSHLVKSYSDTYAVGAMLYEMVTDYPYLIMDAIAQQAVLELMVRHPLESIQAGVKEMTMQKAMCQAVIEQMPPDPRKYRPDVPPLLADVIMKSLSKDPNRRFQTAEEFIEALDTVQLAPSKKPQDVIASDSTSKVGSLLMHARQEKINHNFNEAFRLLREAQQISPYDAGICLELARIYNMMGQHEEAIHILSQAYEHNPDNYIVLRDLGFTYARLQKCQEALDALNKSLGINYNQTEVIRRIDQLKRSRR